MRTSTDIVLDMLRQRVAREERLQLQVEVSESTWDQFEAAQRELDESSPGELDTGLGKG
jgi:hypothetical protein